MSQASRLFAAWAVALSLLVPGAVRAEDPIAAARLAFKEGEAAEKKRDLPLALSKFQKALAIKETPQLLMRVGGVLEKLGQLAKALDHYERGVAKANAQGLRAVVKVAQDQIDLLRPRVPTVVVTFAKPYADLTVKLDEFDYQPGQKLRLDPGEHKLVADAKGFERREKIFSVSEREELSFQLDLVPVASAAPAVATGPAEAPPAKQEGNVVPVVLIAGGGAAVVAGVVFFVVATSKNGALDEECKGPSRPHCPGGKANIDRINGEVSTVKTFQVVAGVSGGLGLASAGIGTYLLLRKPDARPRTGILELRGPGGIPIGISPDVGLGRSGLAFAGVF